MKRLQWLMSRYTGYVGVTNHMGAKFEAAPIRLTPVLEELKGAACFMSMTGASKDSTVSQIAGTIGLDYSVANVQIDARQLSPSNWRNSRPRPRSGAPPSAWCKATSPPPSSSCQTGRQAQGKGSCWCR